MSLHQLLVCGMFLSTGSHSLIGELLRKTFVASTDQWGVLPAVFTHQMEQCSCGPTHHHNDSPTAACAFLRLFHGNITHHGGMLILNTRSHLERKDVLKDYTLLHPPVMVLCQD